MSCSHITYSVSISRTLNEKYKVLVKYNIHQKPFLYVAAYLTAMFLIRPWLLVEGTFLQMKKEFLNKEIIEWHMT